MPDRVTRWLTELGLGEYADAFAEQKVTYEDLIELDSAETCATALVGKIPLVDIFCSLVGFRLCRTV